MFVGIERLQNAAKESVASFVRAVSLNRTVEFEQLWKERKNECEGNLISTLAQEILPPQTLYTN